MNLQDWDMLSRQFRHELWHMARAFILSKIWRHDRNNSLLENLFSNDATVERVTLPETR